ncbi:OmpA family protein [Aeromonas molluscorum]|uniref:Major outer membrane protein OmpAII n=1 Tax=Aeromonas molluscorum 848 TaxID=1268236 RepID=R1H7R3_9GAMM|nr:OmpA family protein [Aeromonas molluscorum]EOD54484.1 major outer membrane protein OmpAII [Aeromonas molluscorum 848]
MKPSLLSALIAVAFASAASLPAQANDWYVGGGGGVSIGHDLDDLGSDVDKNDTAWSLFGGYNFTENFGAELGYLNTGDWSVDGEQFSSQGATLSAIGRLPLGDIFSLFAEGGAYIYQVDTINGSDNDYAPLLGLGMGAQLTDWLDLQARYRYMFRVGDDPDNGKLGSGTDRWVTDVSVATLELVFHPNRHAYVAPVAAPMVAAAVAPVMVDKSFSLSSDVLFAFNKATLKTEGSSALDDLYQQIVEVNPKDGQITVMGYTDRIGSDGYNQTLSEARARTVADYLVGKGLPADRVSTQGLGESNPVSGSQCDGIKAKSDLITCLAPDRRVEVKVTGTQTEQTPAPVEPQPMTEPMDSEPAKA